jgi:protein-S-isoprenylcysteine O-methyltransferase Ste14
MYVSVLVVVFGQALLFGDERLFVHGALFWLACHLFVVTYEEPTLAQTFKDEFERYLANVPRWLPRWSPCDAA